VNVFGAVEPETGEIFYRIEEKEKPEKKKPGRRKKWARKPKGKPQSKGEKSRQMNEFMRQLCDAYPNDHIVLVCDNAWWHKSKYTVVPEQMTVIFIPPYTPEMNPIEQIWREVRTVGFANKCLRSVDAVVDNLRDALTIVQPKTIQSITQRDWIMICLN